jgi:hypothetical protein
MLLAGWWSGIGLAQWCVARWEKHNWSGSHWESAAAHKHPTVEREAGKTDEKALCQLSNQMIQEFGHTSARNHRAFHTILLGFFYSWQLWVDISQQISC